MDIPASSSQRLQAIATGRPPRPESPRPAASSKHLPRQDSFDQQPPNGVSANEPDAATLKDWMARLFTPGSPLRRTSIPLPSPAVISPSPNRSPLSRAGSLADDVEIPRLRHEPVLIQASPRASDELSEALSDEIFPHAPHPRRTSISRPVRAHLSPSRSPRSPPHSHHQPQLLSSLTRSTLPTSSLSLQSLPPVHLSSSPSNMRRSSSLFNRSNMLSTEQVGRSDSVNSLRSLHTTGTDEWWWNDWWGSKKDRRRVGPLLEEEDRGRNQAESAETIQRKYKTPKNPLIFCHGLLGFDAIALPLPLPLSNITLPPIHHWRGITDVLRTNGVEVFIMRVPATSGIAERAKVLREKVAESAKGRKVHLIGHSMGGLDCRYLVSKLDPEVEVLTVTTIASPHRGSSFADYFVHELIGRERLPAVISLLDTLLPNANGDGTAFEELTLESMAKFNEEVKDREGVKYYSWGATYEPGLVDSFRWPHSVILAKEGPNDGLVSVKSAQWGKYLGTLQHVNHLDLIGWLNTARYRWAEFLGNKIEYRPATFYLNHASFLAEVEEEMERREREDGGVD